MVKMVDTVYTRKPQHFEPGPDFAELKVDVDFSVKPAFWVRNEVVLKPGAKVFVKSGDHPILVGRQLGKGRVACLLVDHRGKSGDGTTAFFDWQDWPALARAVMEWLAPAAGTEVPRNVAPAGADDALAALQRSDREDELGNLDDLGAEPGMALLGETSEAVGVELTDKELEGRVALINKALGSTSLWLAAVMARQYGTIANLPVRERMAILQLLGLERPENAGKLGENALKSESSALQGNAYCLLALAGDARLPGIVASLPALRVESREEHAERLHDLALAVALYRKPELLAEGKKRIQAWNSKETAIRDDFARMLQGDDAMLETSPCLPADDIFARLGWLAYLSRHDPNAYGRQFLHEWLRIDQYRDYCGRTRHYLKEDRKQQGAALDVFSHLRLRLQALQAVTRADAEAILSKAPEEAAKALSEVRFSKDVRSAINLLADQDTASTAAILRIVDKGKNQDLAAFAGARLAADGM
jgi:hypothetical protein